MTKNAKGRQRHTQKTEMPKDLVKKEYTDEEKARIVKYFERAKREPVKFKSGGNSSGNPCLELHTDDAILGMAKSTEAFGTPDADLHTFLLNQVVQTFRGATTSEGFNYGRMVEFSNNAMALLNGIQPRYEIEGMLAVQMIAVHNMAMDTMMRAMIEGQTVEGRESNINYATKMLRTFAAQMEALKRYRTGGQQRVTVEHVHVSEGGQAIVGAVSTGGRGYGEQRHE